MPEPITGAIIAAALGYLALRGRQQPGTVARPVVPPHLRPDAQLLTDDQIIAAMNITPEGLHRAGGVIRQSLQLEQIAGGPVQQSTNMGAALQATRAGQIALTGVSGIITAGATSAAVPGTFAAYAAAQTSTGVAGGGLGAIAGAALAPATIAIFGVGAVLSILSIIFAHHRAQVARERNYINAGLPAANEALRVIEQAVTSGQIPVKIGNDALATLVTDWQRDIIGPAKQQGVYKYDRTHCDALCVYDLSLTAVIRRKQDRYRNLIA